MPFIQADFGKDYEDSPVPEGVYDLTIIQAEDQTSKNSKADMVRCLIKIDGEVEAAPIFHYLVFPISKKQAADRGVEEDDQAKIRNKMRGLSRFLTLFAIPFENKGFNTEDLIGATASDVPIAQEEYEGQVKNTIKLPPVSR